MSRNRNQSFGFVGEHWPRTARNVATLWYEWSHDPLRDDGRNRGGPSLGRVCAKHKCPLHCSLHHVSVPTISDDVCTTAASVCARSVIETPRDNNHSRRGNEAMMALGRRRDGQTVPKAKKCAAQARHANYVDTAGPTQLVNAKRRCC